MNCSETRQFNTICKKGMKKAINVDCILFD